MWWAFWIDRWPLVLIRFLSFFLSLPLSFSLFFSFAISSLSLSFSVSLFLSLFLSVPFSLYLFPSFAISLFQILAKFFLENWEKFWDWSLHDSLTIYFSSPRWWKQLRTKRGRTTIITRDSFVGWPTSLEGAGSSCKTPTWLWTSSTCKTSINRKF